MLMNPEVDAAIAKAGRWQEAFRELRVILLGSGLREEVKWGQPCYTLDGKNVVLIHGFNDYCAVLFFKGALINDPDGVLVQQTANVQSARQMRYTGADEVRLRAAVLTRLVQDAIVVEKGGLKVQRRTTADFDIPEEFLVRLQSEPGLQEAFDRLSPGRQRGYLVWFAQPKQSVTRAARVEKVMPRIMMGKGLND